MAKGLTNSYVEKLSKKILKNINFKGVYPCDIHPKIKNNIFSVIFNTGDSQSHGEHFVAIYANEKNLFYFDSFGENIYDVNIKKFINNVINSRKLIINTNKIQDDGSTFCGFFCIAFLLSKEKRVKYFKNIFKKDNLMKNNDIAVNFIIKFIQN